LDKNDRFLNFLGISGSVIGPDLKPLPLKMDQVAPGRYVGEFLPPQPGSYFMMLSPGPGVAPVRTGVNVPYSEEFRDRDPNESLLGELAAMVPEGGRRGEVLPAMDDAAKPDVLAAGNTFRHDLPKATSSQDAWHWLMLAACWAFFADVFVRRVQVGFGWVPALARKAADTLLRRVPAARPSETIERLRSRKAEVAQRVEQLRASTRFETPAESRPSAAGSARAESDALSPLGEPPPEAPRPAPPPAVAPSPSEEDSYTARLLRAKKQVWKDRPKTDEPEEG
jgi:hypothetical protein